MRNAIAALLALWFVVGCSKSAFTGEAALGGTSKKGGSDNADGDENDEDANGKRKDGTDGDGDADGDADGDGDAEGDTDGTDSDPDGGGVDTDTDGTNPDPLHFDDDEVRHEAKACTTATIKFAPDGGEKCPKNYAAFTADDWKIAKIACCPLPTGDMLAKQDPVARGNACQSDEVATGANAQGLLCTKINTKRYKLDVVQKTCYVGSGHSGGDGSTPCGAPSATLQAMVATFGSDACIGQPFGALITAWRGKNCTDVESMRLLYKASGKPVKMLP